MEDGHLVAPGGQRLHDSGADGPPLTGGHARFAPCTGDVDRDVDQVAPPSLDVDAPHGEVPISGMSLGDRHQDAPGKFRVDHGASVVPRSGSR